MTRRDVLRFVREYSGLSLRDVLTEKSALLAASQREGEKIYRRYYEKKPQFPLQFNAHPGKDI